MIGKESPDWMQFDTRTLGGHRIVTASRADLARAMSHDCMAARKHFVRPRLVFDANGHGLSLSETNAAYRAAVDCADIIHADGAFLVALSRLTAGAKILDRSATTDMIHDCAREAAAQGLSFYLLGGEEEINAECARRLSQLYPGLHIVGRHHGFFTNEEEKAVVESINALQPDVLWVGLGKPREQIFSVAWRDDIHAGWIVTCGGCFNYIVGLYTRAPLFLQSIGMEWLWRAFSERRLFWRYLITSPHALWVVVRNMITPRGVGGRDRA